MSTTASSSIVMDTQSILTRSDGTPFVVRAYRQWLVRQKKVSIPQQIRAIAAKRGAFACLFKKESGLYEGVFAKNPGFLLGESIQHYFREIHNLLFLETLPQRNETLLIVLQSGHVYLDALLPSSQINAQLEALTKESFSYQVVTSTDTPVHLPPPLVRSMEILREPLFPRLPALSLLQLAPVADLLRAEKFAPPPPPSSLSQRTSEKKYISFRISKKTLILSVITLLILSLLNLSAYSPRNTNKDAIMALPPEHTLLTVKNNALWQKQYLKLMNQYQISLMQYRLLKEKIAIAMAKKQIALINVQTKQLNNQRKVKTPKIPVSDASRIQPYSVDDIFLLELPPSNYTIELAHARTQKKLMHFAKAHRLEDKVMYPAVLHHGQPGYVLLYDHFNSQEEAAFALQHLPNSLRHGKIVLKSVGDIQQMIKVREQMSWSP